MSQLKSLKHLGTVMSLEAVSGETALVSALSRLPSFLQKTHGVFREQFDRGIRTILEFAANFHSSTARLRRVDYAQAREKLVQVPPGLDTDLLTYANVLGNAAKSLGDLNATMVQPYTAWLNTNLSNPDSLRSLTGGIEVAGYKAINIGALEEAVAKCFVTKGREEAMVPYGKAIKRSQDWNDIDRVCQDIRHVFTPAFHKEVQKNMDELSVTLETLILRLTKAPAKYTPNAKVLQEIVTVSYAVAEGIEFYGILRHRYQELEHSIDQIANDLR